MRNWLSGLAMVKILVIGGMMVVVIGCTKEPRQAEPQARTETNARPEPAPAPVPVIVYDPKQRPAPEPGPDIVDEKPDTPKLIARPPAVPVFTVPSLPTPTPAPEPPVTEPMPTFTQGIKPKEKDGGKEPKKDAGKEPKNEFKVPEKVGDKTFDQWRKELKSNDPTKRETAMRSICLFGAEKAYEALKDIIDELNRHKKTPIDLDVRVNGIMALNTIFRHKKRPNEKDDKEGAALFEKHVKDAHGVYKMFLKDQQVIMKVRSVQGLPDLGWSARDLLDDVIFLAKDPISWEVRQEAIKVMVVMARDSNKVPDSKALLQLRKAVVGTIGGAGKDRDPSYIVRTLAVQGLGAIGDSTVIADLKKAITNDESKEVRVAAVLALAAVGKTSALVDLWKLLESPTKEIRHTTLQIFPAMKLEGADKSKTIQKLKDHLSSEPDPVLNLWTHAVIITLDPATEMKSHMTSISQRLKHEDLTVRLTALQMINMGGEKAKPFVLEPVVALLKDKDLKVAIPAMGTLVFIQAFETIPLLESIVKDAKADQTLKDAAQDTIDAFTLLKKHLEKAKDKKTPDKK